MHCTQAQIRTRNCHFCLLTSRLLSALSSCANWHCCCLASCFVDTHPEPGAAVAHGVVPACKVRLLTSSAAVTELVLAWPTMPVIARTNVRARCSYVHEEIACTLDCAPRAAQPRSHHLSMLCRVRFDTAILQPSGAYATPLHAVVCAPAAPATRARSSTDSGWTTSVAFCITIAPAQEDAQQH